MKQQTANKPKKTIKQIEVIPPTQAEDFPTRRALEELNENTRHHYVTRHGGGTQSDANTPSAKGPMDDEA